MRWAVLYLYLFMYYVYIGISFICVYLFLLFVDVDVKLVLIALFLRVTHPASNHVSLAGTLALTTSGNLWSKIVFCQSILKNNNYKVYSSLGMYFRRTWYDYALYFSSCIHTACTCIMLKIKCREAPLEQGNNISQVLSVESLCYLLSPRRTSKCN